MISAGVLTDAPQLQHKFHYSCQISVITENLFANKRLGKNEIEMSNFDYQETKKLVFQLIVKVKLINDDEKISAGRARTEQFVSVDKTIRLA